MPKVVVDVTVVHPQGLVGVLSIQMIVATSVVTEVIMQETAVDIEEVVVVAEIGLAVVLGADPGIVGAVPGAIRDRAVVPGRAAPVPRRPRRAAAARAPTIEGVRGRGRVRAAVPRRPRRTATPPSRRGNGAAIARKAFVTDRMKGKKVTLGSMFYAFFLNIDKVVGISFFKT